MFYCKEGCKLVGVSDVSGALFCDDGLDGEEIRRFALQKKFLSTYPLTDGMKFVAGKEGNALL